MAGPELTKKPKRPTQVPRTCGCYRKRNRSSKWKGHGDLSGSKWKNIKNGARHRKLHFDLSIEYVWNLFVAQDRRCALTGLPLAMSARSMAAGQTTASLDRIDSQEGYVEGNVQWVHRTINFMKHSMSQNDFIDWCQRVAEHSGSPSPLGAEFGKSPTGKPGHNY